MFSFGKKKGLRNLSKKPSKKKRISLIILVFLVFISCLVFLFWLFEALKIEIFVEEAKCLDGVNLKQEVGLLGKSMFLIDRNKIEFDLRKKYPCVERVEFKKKFPFEVFIKVSGKKPLLEVTLNTKPLFGEMNLEEASSSTQEALLKAEPNLDSSKSFLVDQNGLVFAKASANGNFQVEYVAPKLEVGDLLQKKWVQNAAIIIEKVKEAGIEVKRVIFDHNILFFEGKPQLLFSLDKDPIRQSASLQLILQKAKMDSKEMDKIDLRFDKIIVVYSPKKK